MTREEAIEYLLQYDDEDVFTPKCIEAHKMAIKALKERPKGKWINSEIIENIHRCSNCNATCNGALFTSNLKYCFNCGARMKKGE